MQPDCWQPSLGGQPQLRRTRGWRLPADAVVIRRPTKWGNPYDVEEYGRQQAVALHRWLVTLPEMEPYRQAIRDELAGRDLACVYPLDQPCHADILLELPQGSCEIRVISAP